MVIHVDSGTIVSCFSHEIKIRRNVLSVESRLYTGEASVFTVTEQLMSPVDLSTRQCKHADIKVEMGIHI